MTTLSIDTPEPQEAIERWRQGKINIFDEMARLERERDEAITRRMETIMQCELYEQERDEARDQLIHLRSCVYDVIHSLKARAFDELEKAWKEGLK